MSAQTTPTPPLLGDLLPLLQEGLAREGRARFRLRGDSMRPTLPPACEILIVPLPRRPRLGSLIVFASARAGSPANGSALIAHRLVRRAAAQWIAHGDGRLAADPPLAPAQVLGIVAAAHCDGRRIWPGRAEPLLRIFWLARHHALRPVRAAWRRVRGRQLSM